MYFSTAALLAFAASVVAQNPLFNPITRPSEKEEVTEGSTFKIQWTAPEEFADVTVSISLIGGPEQDKQQPLVDIASGIPNSAESYDWKVPGDLAGFPWYGIKIVSEANEEDYQYSNPFLVVADPNAPASSSGDYGVSTTTITTASGTATVTLSVASTSSSSSEVSSSSVEESSSSSAVESSSAEPSTSAPATTLTTATTTEPVSSPTESSEPEESEPAQVDDSAATHAKAGLFALVGGLAVALML